MLVIMATMWTTAMQAQEYYDLTIALVQVTSRNCNDLSFITGVSGTVKYDNATKTLTLKNASIKVDKYKNAISSKIDGLTIGYRRQLSMFREQLDYSVRGCCYHHRRRFFGS